MVFAGQFGHEENAEYAEGFISIRISGVVVLWTCAGSMSENMVSFGGDYP